MQFTSLEWWYLLLFAAVFIVALVLDIGMHKRKQETSIKNALIWTCIWAAVSLAFAWVTGRMLGADHGQAFLAGWVLEKTLAIDNLFAFIAVFASFGIQGTGSAHIQHRILHYGIIGAIVARVIMLVGLGFLLSLKPPVSGYITIGFAVAVLLTAWGMLKSIRKRGKKEEVDYTKHWSVRLTSRIFPVEPSLAGGQFFVRKVGADGRKRLYGTMSLLCLICIEVVDVGFSFDSMPAIAAVVKYPPVMISASLMAVAGLRALYFALLAASNRFVHLEKAILFLLVYIPIKLVVEEFELFHISNTINLIVILATIGVGIVASLLAGKRKQ